MTNSELDLLADEMRREYFRKWREQNKDKVRRHNQNYWRKKAEERLKEQENEQHVSTG